MPRKHKTPGVRLLIYLARVGGNATAWQIARRQANGRLLRDALPEIKDLITIEEGRSARSRRPVRRVILTEKGIAAASLHVPGFQPVRIPKALLLDTIQQLQAECDKWACSIAENEDAAKELAALKKAGRIRPWPPKRPGPPPGTISAGSIRPGSNRPPSMMPSPAPVPISRPVLTPRPASAGSLVLPLARPSPPPPQLSFQELEARRLESERRQRNCPICQSGVDPNFLLHDPGTHLAYLR